MKKTLAWITWLSLSAVSPIALAVGLGQASVSSYLNAPLSASIPLLEGNEYALGDIHVSIAESADFAAAGLEWTPLAASVRALVQEQQGQRRVVLSSERAMDEPWLELLLTIEYPGGQQVREVTLLFDPQGYAQPAALAVSATSATRPQATETIPSTPTRISERDNRRGDSAYISSGDTLWGVAERLKPSQASVQQTMIALLEANPEVFPSGNIHDMRAGQTLLVPEDERILARSHRDADAAIQAMNNAWRGRRNGSLQPVPLPEIETATVSDVSIAAAQTLQAKEEEDPDSALAAGGAEAEGDEAAAVAGSEASQGQQGESQPEALSRAELTEQLRLSQATLQQVLEERELMRTELNQLRAEVGSLTQALSKALAAQPSSPEPIIASMDETDNSSVGALIERYQWPLALAAITLLLALLVWLRKRREETWEDIPRAEPVVKPTASSGRAPDAPPMPKAVHVAYPTQPNDDAVVDESHKDSGQSPAPQRAPKPEAEAEPQAETDVLATNITPPMDTDQWLVDDQEQVPEPADTSSYEKSQAAGLAEQGRQRRLGLHPIPEHASEKLSLAPPPSALPMRQMLATYSAGLQLSRPAAAVDTVQTIEDEPKAPEDAGHRFIDYHPPVLSSDSSSQQGVRTETPMQPTVEFSSQPQAEPKTHVKKPRRPIEEEWEIEEVAFKPRGLDNGLPSKSSK